MPEHVQQLRGRIPRALGNGADVNDIFCLVKGTMASKELCQDPLLVWPASLEASARDAFKWPMTQAVPFNLVKLMMLGVISSVL